MKRKNIVKAVVFAIALAFLMPGVFAIADNEDDIQPITSNEGDIIIDEDFESDWVPFRWSVIKTTDELNQEIPCWWHQYFEEGENYAGLWMGTLPQDEWLMTPALDLSVWTDAKLSFSTYNFGLREGCWEGDFVKISPDGGETWDVLANLYDLAPPGGSFFGDIIEIDIPEYAGLKEVIVAFHRETGDPNINAGWWLIDDVIITAYDTIPIPVVDIRTISGGFGVTAIIENVGTGEATDIEWSITTEDLLGIILFGGEEGGTISSLLPGESFTVLTGLLFGLGLIEINVTADYMWETTSGLVLGPFVATKMAKNYVPADDMTINWAQCTLTVDISTKYPNLNGQHSVQFIDKDGNVLGSKSGPRFTNGVATFSVENWLKNKLNAGGSVNVRV